LFSICRESFHLDGFIISDCGGVENIMTGHNYTSTLDDTVAAALHAGVDIDCGNFYEHNAQSALANHTIIEADIDLALIRAFMVLIRLGYFDPPEQQPYRNLTVVDIDTVEARQLALQSSQESIVLLKNMKNALPLNLDQLKNKKIALIGPSINATILMQGNYHGRAPFIIDPITAFKTITTGIIFIFSLILFDIFILR
jgi:beta-glucosidase-like glycosyl hydrolase